MVGGVPVFQYGYQTQVEHGEIHLHILVNLLGSHLRVAIKVFEGFVDELEDALSILPLVHVFLGYLLDLQIIAFANHLGYLGIFLGHFVGYVHLVLHVVVVFFPSLQLLHVFGVIGIVVDGELCAHVFKAVGEHTLAVHIGKAQRSHYLVHAALFAPLLHGVQQRLAHLYVVDKVYPAKAHTLTVPFAVGSVVDDGCHASHHLALFVCQEVVGLAKLKGGVLVLVQGKHLVAIQIGHCVLTITIQVVIKLYESVQISFAGYLSYFYF